MRKLERHDDVRAFIRACCATPTAPDACADKGTRNDGVARCVTAHRK